MAPPAKGGAVKKRPVKDTPQERAPAAEAAEPRLSAAESLRIRDAFNKVDMNHTGALDGLELRQLFLELGRLDLDPDREVDEIRRLGSKRKNGRVTEADRIDLRATLAYFAYRPRPVITEDEACSKHLFQTLTATAGEKHTDATVSIHDLGKMLRECYELEVDMTQFVKGADHLNLSEFQALCSTKMEQPIDVCADIF